MLLLLPEEACTPGTAGSAATFHSGSSSDGSNCEGCHCL